MGTSLALWGYNYVTGLNAISTSEVKIEFLESSNEVIAITNAIPLSDESGKVQSEVFEFQVTTTATNKNIRYNLNIEKIANQSGYTELNDSYVKVYLTDYEDNPLVGPIKVSELSNYNLYSKVNSHSGTNEELKDKYKLRIWVDESAENAFDWSVQSNLYYNFRIGVSSEEVMPTGVETLISKVWGNGLERIMHEGDNTLQEPFNNDTVEYRYRGTNPNNYISFNNELWRIIGVFPTDDGTGNIENRIKIIKNESIGVMTWNDCLSSDGEKCDSTGKNTNDWTGASLNIYLNGEYYDSLTIEAQNMIDDIKYYLGGGAYRVLMNPPVANNLVRYNYERKFSGSDFYYDNNPNSVISKIGLMYPSDYMYAAIGCDDKMAYVSTGDDIRLCNSTNWLYLGINEWTITQYLNLSNNLLCAFHVSYSGLITNHRVVNDTGEDENVRPVLYLSSDVIITGGTGSIDNPYTLSK